MTRQPTPPPPWLDALLSRFRNKRILVIGDVMLDEFVWGRVGRISPEAPVPIVEVEKQSYYPGGRPTSRATCASFPNTSPSWAWSATTSMRKSSRACSPRATSAWTPWRNSMVIPPS